MNAIESLKSQHRRVERLFVALNKSKNVGERQELAKELVASLTLHMELEERIFYPAVEDIAEKRVRHSFEEHDEVRPLLTELLELWDKPKEFRSTLAKIKSLVDHHVREEETDLFPKCQYILGRDSLGEIGEEMEKWLQKEERRFSGRRDSESAAS